MKDKEKVEQSFSSCDCASVCEAQDGKTAYVCVLGGTDRVIRDLSRCKTCPQWRKRWDEPILDDRVSEEFIRKEEEDFQQEFGNRCFVGEYADMAQKLTEEGFYLVDGQLYLQGMPCEYNSERVAEILE